MMMMMMIINHESWSWWKLIVMVMGQWVMSFLFQKTTTWVSNIRHTQTLAWLHVFLIGVFEKCWQLLTTRYWTCIWAIRNRTMTTSKPWSFDTFWLPTYPNACLKDSKSWSALSMKVLCPWSHCCRVPSKAVMNVWIVSHRSEHTSCKNLPSKPASLT